MRVWQVRAVLWLVDLSEPAIDHPTTPPPLPLLLAVCGRIIQHNTAVSVIRATTATTKQQRSEPAYPQLTTHCNFWSQDNSR